jgi:hypothetical protein
MRSLDAKYVQDEITTLLLAHPELAEDEVLRADSIEGETGTFEFLSGIVRKVGATNAMALGTSDYIEELSRRKARLERRADALRGLIVKIMDSASIRKAELPEATLSIRSGQQKVLIINEREIPDDFMRMRKEPDKTRIKAAMLANENVPGAVLSNGQPSLAISIR